MKTIEQALTQALNELDITNNPYREQVIAAVQRSIVANKPLELLLFTCSTIKANELFSVTPWNYVSLNPQGNNLTDDLIRLQEVIKSLWAIYQLKLTVIIGNTDPYYIYLQQFANIPKEERQTVRDKFEERWAAYKIVFEAWLRDCLPQQELEVISWQVWERQQEKLNNRSFEQEFNQVYANAENYFAASELDWEFRKLSTQFATDKYFSDLAKPTDELLKDWIHRKFTEYALQGKWLQEAFPNAVLLQNEKPTLLRSAMYQPLLRPLNRALPIMHPFGLDNEGYA